MLAVNDAPSRANWEVLWIRNKKVQRKDCGHDLMEAMRIFMLATEAGRKGVTLRCKNMGFPPPAKYLPYEAKMKKPLDKPKIIRKDGKRYVKKFEVVVITKNPMKDLNTQGIWWCPYCMKLRRFVKRYETNVGKVRVPDTAMVCPMCGIPHRDFNVRKYNPIATQVYYELEAAPQRAPSRNRKANFEKKKRRRQPRPRRAKKDV